MKLDSYSTTRRKELYYKTVSIVTIGTFLLNTVFMSLGLASEGGVLRRASPVETRTSVLRVENDLPLPEEILSGEKGLIRSSPMSSEDIRHISYWLDQVEYVGDRELREAIVDPGRAKSVIEKLFSREEQFYIQNNRKLNRDSKCSGRCWYCFAYRIPLLERQRKTRPIDIPDSVAILNKAIRAGYTNIQINGEDTLDDLESFWALVDACKDKPIGFCFLQTDFIY